MAQPFLAVRLWTAGSPLTAFFAFFAFFVFSPLVYPACPELVCRRQASRGAKPKGHCSSQSMVGHVAEGLPPAKLNGPPAYAEGRATRPRSRLRQGGRTCWDWHFLFAFQNLRILRIVIELHPVAMPAVQFKGHHRCCESVVF